MANTTSLTGLSPNNPLKYLGPNVAILTVVSRKRPPTSADFRQPETGKLYPMGCMWLIGKDPTSGTEGEIYFLSKIQSSQAYWVNVLDSADSIETLNATPQFVQVGDDLILDFRLANLILGGPSSHITSALFNVAYGFDAITELTTGGRNSAYGASSAVSLTTGSDNTFLGYFSGSGIETGSRNTIIGARLNTHAECNNCVLIGYGVAGAGGGTRNIIIGDSAGSNYNATESSNINIGAPGTSLESNTIRIGVNGSGSGQQNSCFISAINGNTTTPSNLKVVTIDSATDQLAASDGYIGTISTAGFATGYVIGALNHITTVNQSIIGIRTTVAPRTVFLPTAGMTIGQQWIIKDESGGAAANNITVNPGAFTIDGAASLAINTNYGVCRVYWSGVNFFTF